MKVKDLVNQYFELQTKLDDISDGRCPYIDLRGKIWKLIPSQYSDRYSYIKVEGLFQERSSVSVQTTEIKRTHDIVFMAATAYYGEEVHFMTLVLDADKEETT